MMSFKKIMLRLLLLLEIVVFGHIYMYGKNGIESLNKQKALLYDCENSIVVLNNELALLQKEIHAWLSDDFYKEKIAREQLQMARKGDELFYRGV